MRTLLNNEDGMYVVQHSAFEDVSRILHSVRNLSESLEVQVSF